MGIVQNEINKDKNQGYLQAPFVHFLIPPFLAKQALLYVILSQPQTGLYLVWQIISLESSSHSHGLILLFDNSPIELHEAHTPSKIIKVIKAQKNFKMSKLWDE